MEGPTGELVGVDFGAVSILPVPLGQEIVVNIRTVNSEEDVPLPRLVPRFLSVSSTLSTWPESPLHDDHGVVARMLEEKTTLRGGMKDLANLRLGSL